jgi:hypothetical protein
MSQPSPSFHPEDKSNSENETNSGSDSPSELDQRFSFKISRKRTKHRYSPYIIPLENSPSLENDEQIATAGSSDEQIVIAGSSRKRKDEKPIESKEAKRVKLISVENLKEKGKIYILLYMYTILTAIELYIM